MLIIYVLVKKDAYPEVPHQYNHNQGNHKASIILGALCPSSIAVLSHPKDLFSDSRTSTPFKLSGREHPMAFIFGVPLWYIELWTEKKYVPTFFLKEMELLVPSNCHLLIISFTL